MDLDLCENDKRNWNGHYHGRKGLGKKVFVSSRCPRGFSPILPLETLRNGGIENPSIHIEKVFHWYRRNPVGNKASVKMKKAEQKYTTSFPCDLLFLQQHAIARYWR